MGFGIDLLRPKRSDQTERPGGRVATILIGLVIAGTVEPSRTVA